MTVEQIITILSIIVPVIATILGGVRFLIQSAVQRAAKTGESRIDQLKSENNARMLEIENSHAQQMKDYELELAKLQAVQKEREADNQITTSIIEVLKRSGDATDSLRQSIDSQVKNNKEQTDRMVTVLESLLDSQQKNRQAVDSMKQDAQATRDFAAEAAKRMEQSSETISQASESIENAVKLLEEINTQFVERNNAMIEHDSKMVELGKLIKSTVSQLENSIKNIGTFSSAKLIEQTS